MTRLLLFFLLLNLWACSGNRDSVNQNEETEPRLKIAYNVFENEAEDDYEIYIMNLDGSGKKNISNWKGVDWVYYAWKDKLYFLSDRDTAHRKYFLYEMDSDGTNIRRITDFLVDDSWLGSRRQGQELVVKPLRRQNPGFYLINRDGQVLDTLLQDSIYKNDPFFSPDGNFIVFRMKPGDIDELWIMDVTDGNLKQITHYPEGDTSITRHGYHAGPARWNAREGFITYQSKQAGKYSLYAVTPDGQRQFKLLDFLQNEGYHDWSPNGRWLALELFDDAQSLFNIYLLDFQTKELKQLTDSERYEQAPVFVEQ